jgi:large subunit ribosomal protein L1
MKKEKKYDFDQEQKYPLSEAIKIVKDNAKAKFEESLEIHVRIGIDPKKGDQQIRSTVILPHGTGKTKKICVFTENEKEALSAGADMAGGEELIQKIKTKGIIDFDIAVATPDMMRHLAPIAKVLGPKGLMPSPKNETVSTNIKKTIEDLKGGKVAFKNDETANIHQLIGKVSWEETKLNENFGAFFDGLKKVKPASSKGAFIRQISICSTMGPGVKVEI